MRRVLRLAAAGLLWLVSAGTLAAPAEPFQILSTEQVSKLVGAPGIHLIDFNGPGVYAKAHLPGAVLRTYADLDRGNLPADKDATLVFYCKNPG